MSKWLFERPWVLLLVLFAGCAGTARSCSSCSADNFGADWVVVQYDFQGRPFRCWALQNQSITNEPQSDGIYWLSDHGNLVHISGLYNRVQVENSRWDEAFAEVGLTQDTCEQLQHRRFDLERGSYGGQEN